jgi:hypothetical protein
MRMIFLIFVFAFTTNFDFANEIDNLKTNKEVNKFLSENVLPKDSTIVALDENKANPAPFGKNKFYKLDLDNNGLTDLVIDGKYFLAVSDKGNKEFGIHLIDRGAFSDNKYTLVNILSENGTQHLIIRSYNADTNKIGEKVTEKNLILKFNDFMEFNSKPDDFKIEEIKFSTSGCFGSCPIFNLNIGQNKTASYEAIEYNDEKGIYKSPIDAASFDSLVQTINYIGLLNLKNKYRVPWTDDQASTLEIKYNHGKIKSISDYGMIGTFGLENLYNQLFKLRKSQKWVKQSS